MTGQTKLIDSYIAQLSDNKFHIEPGYITHFRTDTCKAYDRLIKIGKPATEKLILALADTTKTIMSHLTLCMIWYNQASFSGPKIINKSYPFIGKYKLSGDDSDSLSVLYVSETDFKTNLVRIFVDSLDRKNAILNWTIKTKTRK